jgi:hypothetical protein
MLHALTSETKQRDRNRAQPSQLPQDHAHALGLSPPLQTPTGSQELSRLHSLYGNQAVLRMLNRSRPLVQGKCACEGSAGSGALSSEGQLMGRHPIHRKCAECEDRAAAELRSRDSVDDLDTEGQEDLMSVDGPGEKAADAGAPHDAGTGKAGAAGGGTGGANAPAATCPTATAVDTTTDLTPAGLSAGYLTAYGIMARMKVLPDSTNWNGVSVVEANTVGSSTCPATLTHPGPCTGNATFVVGSASGKSNVQAVQPAMQNRFYDFHTTHTRALSVLHDSTRNPAGLNSCKAVCNQTYSCGGAVIGTHTVTRTFTKGTSGGHDVTIVNVTKK